MHQRGLESLIHITMNSNHPSLKNRAFTRVAAITAVGLYNEEFVLSNGLQMLADLAARPPQSFAEASLVSLSNLCLVKDKRVAKEASLALVDLCMIGTEMMVERESLAIFHVSARVADTLPVIVHTLHASRDVRLGASVAPNHGRQHGARLRTERAVSSGLSSAITLQSDAGRSDARVTQQVAAHDLSLSHTRGASELALQARALLLLRH